jgi:hypothetical protein
MAEMGAVWRGLAHLPSPEPDAALRARFLEVLEAYRAGMEQARQSPVAGQRREWAMGWWVMGWWPARAVWQTALAVALLVAGGFGGHFLALPGTPEPELTQLRGQVESLRQLVALSMLQDQSPSSRIRGVSYGSEAPRPGRQIEQALLYAVNHDANVNVRLSAVDALERLAANPEIRRALVDALPMQDSPLVEVALIDVLVEADDKQAAPALRRLERDAQADESVRQRAADGVRRLEKSK